MYCPLFHEKNFFQGLHSTGRYVNIVLALRQKCCLRADVAQSVERILGKDKVTSSILVISSIFFGGVAQLARACGSYPQCPGFESLRRHHIFSIQSGPGPDFFV